ncbi:probable E3 ubiquitin-protein ligase WAVH2 [Miscanthus floridulus]|uniref:probable E3 ubiquitin-protein ligase WAVH2 n=1 Tax=Miscanthus floridulus TaxID=154761 RepID=UPI003458AC31
MARKSGGQCDACRGDIGLWQAIFTAECAHTFHLRCVSGSATCPICAARWSNTPATAPAPAPATPFSFASSPPPSSTGLFGQSAAAAADSSSKTSLFGQPCPSTTQNSSFSFSGAQTASPSSSLSVVMSLFGQQAPPTPDSAPPATQTPLCPRLPCLQRTLARRCVRGVVPVAVAPPLFLAATTAHAPMARRCVRGVVPVAAAPPQPPMFQPFTPLPQSFGPRPESADMARPVFNDDEPEEPSSLDGGEVVQEATNNGVLELKTHCEHSAVARDTARDTFAVLVHAKGPPVTAEASTRASLDLVTVLDVSGSMRGSKLALLKQAMRFVIDHLGPGDRLCIVAFSSGAHRIIRLTRMSDGGKASAKAAVESLVAQGSTNIRGGLRVASDVLDGRRHRNAVASVILLSDGQDNYTLRSYGYHGPFKGYNCCKLGID